MSILNESLAGRIANFNSGRTDREATGCSPVDGMSYVSGAKSPALEFITIPQLLRDSVSRFGSRDALVFPEQQIRRSYADFEQEVDALATGLLALGLGKGDRLGIWSPNRYEWVLTQFATARIGIILVNINPAYRLSELEHALNKSGCKAVVAAERFKTSEYLSMIRQLAPELDHCEPGRLGAAALPHLRHVIGLCEDPGAGIHSFETVRRLGGPAQRLRLPAIDRTLNPDDAINIQFTSGTTGSPKGATLSHYNIVNNARFVTERILLTELDRLCIPVPLYHCFGMVMGVLGAVSKGAAMVFPGESFTAEPTLRALEGEECTATYGVPTMFLAMLEEIGRTPYDLGRMRTGIMAGAPCPVEVMKRVYREMNMEEVTICYGMTETSPVSFQSFVNDPTDLRCRTVGRVHPHLEVKIVDESDRIVPVGEQGELCTRGYAVMKGYWEDEDRTRESIRDGWMHSGDLARFDEHGYCSIIGRVKDMIIRGGENIYPREVEEFLFGHPKVNDVQVFGIPDERFGEEVCAWVIPLPDTGLDEGEIRSFCQDRIAHYKVPRHIRIVDEIPMTVTGKPQKFVMKNRMLEMLRTRSPE